MHGLTHLFGLLLRHDAGLDLHYQLGALVLDFLLDLAVHLGCHSVLLGGVGKAAQTVELHFLDEVAQILELLLGLAGEARDQGGAQGDAGDLAAQLADDLQQLRTGGAAVHVLEDGIVAVLDGQVEIGHHLLVALHGGDEFIGDALRVGVHTMLGNFQDGSIPGKIQFGSGWWFLDQKEGMDKQMNALSVLGLLSRLVGMLTDSRSFLSYPRHEYFRRTLCNLVGRDVENGEIPASEIERVNQMIEDISYNNAKNFFKF